MWCKICRLLAMLTYVLYVRLRTAFHSPLRTNTWQIDRRTYGQPKRQLPSTHYGPSTLWRREHNNAVMLTILFNVHCAGCPANFKHVASVNGCYKVLKQNLAWSAAGLACRRLHKDAHLLVINDEQEQLSIASMLHGLSLSLLTVLYCCSSPKQRLCLNCLPVCLHVCMFVCWGGYSITAGQSLMTF